MKKHTVTHHPYNEILLMIKRNELLLPAITWINLFIYLSYHLSTCLSSFTYQLYQTSYTHMYWYNILYIKVYNKRKTIKMKTRIHLWKAGQGVIRQSFKREFSRVTVKFYLDKLIYFTSVWLFNACLQKSVPMISTFHCM